MLSIWVASQWQPEATEEFKLEVGLLGITRGLHRDCLGNRARRDLWTPVARLYPGAVAWMREDSRLHQGLRWGKERY